VIDHQAARYRAAESAYPKTGTTKDARTAFADRTPVAIIGAIGANGIRPDWHDDAACRSMGADLFFSERGDIRWVAEAKAVCATCDVVEECLQWAIDTGSRHGVFGGLTPKERQGLKLGKGVRVVRCGTTAGEAKHRRLGEKPCVPCAEARREYQRRATAALRLRRGRVA
jgi:WhiB family redox-sensing transcriptional regulator